MEEEGRGARGGAGMGGRGPPAALGRLTPPPSPPPPSQVYNVTSGKTLPQWLSEKRKRSLRKDEEYR
jgi:hypothetical protein